MGVILLLIVPVSGLNLDPGSDCQFDLAWKGPHYSVHEFADLDGDGLCEILCASYDSEMETYTLIALDIFSTVLWQVQLKGILVSCIYVEDLEDDGLKEMFVDTQISPYIRGKKKKRENSITCINAEGTVLWTRPIETDSEWVDPTYVRLIDTNEDGYKEILVSNLILDRNGDTLYQYDDNFFITGYIENDGPDLIILKKETDVNSSGYENYTVFLRLAVVGGEILWEKEFKTPTDCSLREVEGRKRLLLEQTDAISEVDLTTFEEKPIIVYDADYCGEPRSPRFGINDIDSDVQQEYIIMASDDNRYGNTTLFVYDSHFNLLWEYSDPHFRAYDYDIDNDGISEILIDYSMEFRPSSGPPNPRFLRVLNCDGSERWTVFLESVDLGPWAFDIDIDGDVEFIYHVKMPEEIENGYLLVLSSTGVVEKQVKLPRDSVLFFADLDSDGDTDILLYAGETERYMYVYTNNRLKGTLDTISKQEQLEEVDRVTKGIQRGFWLNPGLYYRYHRFIYFLEHPQYFPSAYAWRVFPLIGVIIVLGIGLIICLVKRLKHVKYKAAE